MKDPQRSPRLHALGIGKLGVYWEESTLNSMWMACIDHYPLHHAGSFNCLNWFGGGTEREVIGGGTGVSVTSVER